MASRPAPNQDVPTVERGVLHYRDDDGEYHIKLVSKTWSNWLMTVTRFYVQTADGRLIVRKEGQRGGPYWWAYRRQSNTVKRVHLGKDDDLSMEQFEAAAVELTRKLAEARTITPVVYRSGWHWDPLGDQPVFLFSSPDGWQARFVSHAPTENEQISDCSLHVRVDPLTKEVYARLVPLGQLDEGKA